jgi:hypothetical protein
MRRRHSARQFQAGAQPRLVHTTERGHGFGIIGAAQHRNQRHDHNLGQLGAASVVPTRVRQLDTVLSDVGCSVLVHESARPVRVPHSPR